MYYWKYFLPDIPSDSPELRAPKLQEGEAGQQGGAVQREEVSRGGHRQVPLQVHTQSPVWPLPACWPRSGYMMTGSPVSWCGSDGSWSPAWALVSCSRSCSYPGATIHGTINPVHFYYSPGQTVTYTCSEVSPALVTRPPPPPPPLSRASGWRASLSSRAARTAAGTRCCPGASPRKSKHGVSTNQRLGFCVGLN